VFLSPLEWSRDANGLMLLITLFSALPHAWDRGYHIRMEVVHVRMPRRWRVAADALAALAGFVFFALLSIQAIAFSGYMLATGETGEDLGIPLWPFMVFVSICGFVLAARLLANPLSNGDSASGKAGEWI
ncbi:MAG TPA: TRAP transporter small permease, partial [Gammaproteobacteria bacterium]